MIFSPKHLSTLIISVALAACATDRSYGGDPGIEVTSLDELPVPTGRALYTFGPLESLSIEVVNAENISGTYLTDEYGRLNFPLVGEIDVDGKTPSQVSWAIADRLRGKYLLDPTVRVIPTDYVQPTISVGGQVEKPGAYPATGKPTLLRLINLAGGASEYAQRDDVLVLRTVDGQKYIGAYSLEAIERGNYADPVLQPEDIVLVGDSSARRRLATILQFVPLLTSSAIIIDRLGP